MDSVEGLETRRADLDNRLKANRKELKACKQRQKDEAKKASRWWKLGAVLTHVVMILVVRASGVTAPAVKMLCLEAQKRKWQPKSEEEVVAVVEDLMIGAGQSELTALCDEEHPSDIAAFKIAASWSLEWDLFQWVDKLNTDKGLAPSTEQVLQKAEQLRRELPEWLRPAAKGIAAEARARVWAFRWRRRWGGRHAKIRCRDDIPLEEMRAKASISLCS